MQRQLLQLLQLLLLLQQQLPADGQQSKLTGDDMDVVVNLGVDVDEDAIATTSKSAVGKRSRRGARGANISNAIDRQCRELLLPRTEVEVDM